ELFERRQQVIVASTRDRHVASSAGQRKRDASANARAAAGDEGRATRQQRLAEHTHRTGSGSASTGSANGSPSVNSRDCSMRGTRSITSGTAISSTTVAACSSRNFRAFTSTLPSSDPTALLYASRLDFNRDPRSSK